MVCGLVWSEIAFRVVNRVPVLPALPSMLATRVISTGVSSGNAVSSASSAVQTTPITAESMSVIIVLRSVVSVTVTP